MPTCRKCHASFDEETVLCPLCGTANADANPARPEGQAMHKQWESQFCIKQAQKYAKLAQIYLQQNINIVSLEHLVLEKNLKQTKKSKRKKKKKRKEERRMQKKKKMENM